jgi:lactate dehydrogenase-like 2-hydroxyacid dehydrogenase
MALRILFPDARFENEPDIERAVAGPDAELVIRDARMAAEIPDDVWASADAIMFYNTVLATEAVAAKATKCRIVVRCGVGYDKIDVEAFGRRGIPVCNTPDYGTTDVADMAIAMLLAFARGVVGYNEALRQDPVGNWHWNRAVPGVRRLRGATLGVVGLGRIGTAAALRGRAFGMDVAFYDPYLPNGTELALGFRRYRTLNELLAASDAVTIHCPLTAETRGLIGPEAISAMKPGALLINTARGPICDLRAIEQGLRQGRLAGVGLDVLPDEPPSADDPLIAAWRRDEPWVKGRLILAPHAAFYSADAFADMRRLSMETAIRYLREGVLQNCVNLSWLKRNA